MRGSGGFKHMFGRVLSRFHPTTRRLLLARAFRSIGQGVLVVDLAFIYMR